MNKQLWKIIGLMLLGIVCEVVGIAIAQKIGSPVLAISVFCIGVAALGYGTGRLAGYIHAVTNRNDLGIWGMIMIAVVSIISGTLIRFIL